MSALYGRVPRLLAEGAAGNGRRYLVTSLAPSTAATNGFTAAHAHFLRVLGSVQGERTSFAASRYCADLTRSIIELEPFVTHEVAVTLWATLRDCRAALAGWTGPFVIAHGDFAPWNIRVEGARIFVFDWEYARAGANALADVQFPPDSARPHSPADRWASPRGDPEACRGGRPGAASGTALPPLP